jgi:hypothetical protein
MEAWETKGSLDKRSEGLARQVLATEQVKLTHCQAFACAICPFSVREGQTKACETEQRTRAIF